MSIKLSLEVIQGFWQRQPSIELCAKECGAECCRRGVEATITSDEIIRLNKKLTGVKLDVYWHEEKKRYRWRIGKPCLFLQKDNMCSIHEDRPECCCRWPAKPTTWCPAWPVVGR
jgi:Fe-S-cluster containining protein